MILLESVDGYAQNTTERNESVQNYIRFMCYLRDFTPGNIAPKDFDMKLMNDVLNCFHFDESKKDVLNGIYDEIEKIEWKPPVLYLTVHRYDGKNIHFRNDDLFEWKIRTFSSRYTITCRYLGDVQKNQRYSCFVGHLVAKIIADKMKEGLDCQYMKWNKSKTRVIVLPNTVIKNDTPKTILAERKRLFKEALYKHVKGTGFKLIKPDYTFEKITKK